MADDYYARLHREEAARRRQREERQKQAELDKLVEHWRTRREESEKRDRDRTARALKQLVELDAPPAIVRPLLVVEVDGALPPLPPFPEVSPRLWTVAVNLGVLIREVDGELVASLGTTGRLLERLQQTV